MTVWVRGYSLPLVIRPWRLVPRKWRTLEICHPSPASYFGPHCRLLSSRQSDIKVGYLLHGQHSGALIWYEHVILVLWTKFKPPRNNSSKRLDGLEWSVELNAGTLAVFNTLRALGHDVVSVFSNIDDRLSRRHDGSLITNVTSPSAHVTLDCRRSGCASVTLAVYESTHAICLCQ